MLESQYRFIKTEDGSPTLEWSQGDLRETMHHPGGAYSETQYIYGWAVRDGLAQGLRSFISVGLGMGYNELLIAAEAIQAGVGPEEIKICSFESVPQLKQRFLKALENSALSDEDQALFQFFEKDYGTVVKMRSWLLQALASKHWFLGAALTAQTEWSQPCEVILYDAFSGNSCPELWQEEFMNDFLTKAAADKAIFSTYACKSSLKRALEQNGFRVFQPSGFHRKRQCTRAMKGIAHYLEASL